MKLFQGAMLCCIAVLTLGCCNCGRKSTKAADLKSTEWVAVEIAGAVVSPSEEPRFTAQFTADGKVNGRGDCNRYFGNYESDDKGTLTIGMLGSTRAMCADQTLEDSFLRLMNEVKRFRIEGDVLMLFNGDGTMIISMKPLKK